MDNEYVTKKMGGAKLLIKKKPEKKKIRKGKNKQTGVNVDKKSYDFKKLSNMVRNVYFLLI